MDSYPGVRSDSVIGFMPRSAAQEHLPLRLSASKSPFSQFCFWVLRDRQMRIKRKSGK
jgi:hypothetical protein